MVPFDSDAAKLRSCVTIDSGSGKRQSCQGWTALPANTPIFDVPDGLLRILNRDLAFAGISEVDERGRTVDVHALRHSFGTHLSRAGVSPRTAQAAMRHSHIDLTMNVYTDPKLLDIQGAIDALPELPIDGNQSQTVTATGTDGVLCPLVPTLVPELGRKADDRSLSCQFSTIGTPDADASIPADELAVSGCAVTTKQPLSGVDNGCHRVGVTGLEPVTSTMSTWRSNQLI